MKELKSKKARFPRFDKIFVIWPIAEVYGESNERQLCEEIAKVCVVWQTINSGSCPETRAFMVYNLVYRDKSTVCFNLSSAVY